jgi:hypothetical protein
MLIIWGIKWRSRLTRSLGEFDIELRLNWSSWREALELSPRYHRRFFNLRGRNHLGGSFLVQSA